MHKNNGICSLGIVPIRKKPSHRSEMVSQLLFGEQYSFENCSTDNDWIMIQSQLDGYEGYIPENQHTILDYQKIGNIILKDNIDISLVHWSNFLPAGSRLNQEEIKTLNLTSTQILNTNNLLVINDEQIINDAKRFLGSPYLWGGRTKYGIDCSGFVQLVFLINGRVISRDAYQQFELGNSVNLQNAKSGDLAFFHNVQQKITHVGIVIANEKTSNLQIIHASGEVRIDDLDDKGIFNIQTNNYSHHFAAIKRLI